MIRPFRPLALALAALGLAAAAGAQDVPGPVGDLGAARMAPSGLQSSPFTPPADSDRRFVVNEGPGLDTGCTFKSGGPLVVEIPVDRYVGELRPDGFLRDPEGMIEAGVIGRFATLSFPVYDIDIDARPEGRAPEIDRVSFNGTELGVLDGANNQWTPAAYRIDIGEVRFAERGARGAAPQGQPNRFVIDIDVANAEDTWCMSLDWVMLEVQVSSPVLLAHGLGFEPSVFEAEDVTEGLREAYLPFDGCGDCENPLELSSWTRQGDVPVPSSNVPRLQSYVRDVVRSFGADSYHLIGHSKGGVDLREYLSAAGGAGPELLSYTSFASPHNGSVLADIAFNHYLLTRSEWAVRYRGFPTFAETALRLSGGPHYVGMTTTNVGGMTPEHVRRLPRTASYMLLASDADRNGNGEIDIFSSEYAGLIEADPFGIVAGAGFNAMYRTNQTVAGTLPVRHETVTEYDEFGVPFTYERAVVEAIPVTTPPSGNDIFVTVESALWTGAGFVAERPAIGAYDHGNILEGGLPNAVDHILRAERSRGDLR